MYSDGDACTNQAESYFSRLRRAVDGQHHHVSPQYLYQYANEAAWREDHCRTDNGSQFKKLTGAALHSPVYRPRRIRPPAPVRFFVSASHSENSRA